MNLLEKLASVSLQKDEIGAAFLGQAGFVLRGSDGTTAAVDPYLGNICEKEFGFKRLIPPPLKPEELKVDILAATHSHRDHLDPDILKALPGETLCVGAMDCGGVFLENGIPPERFTLLKAGDSCTIRGVGFRAVYADHGELAPEAVGFVLGINGFSFFVTGDTAYRPDEMMDSLGEIFVDGMFVPINPAFGNPGAADSVKMGVRVRPGFLAAVHFGMFAEHGGDPEEFMREAGALPAGTVPFVPRAGDLCVYSRQRGLRKAEI